MHEIAYAYQHYELWKGRKPNISYFNIFEYRCFILNNVKDNLKKFDAQSDKDIFPGYSTSSKTYGVFNKCTLVVEASIHVINDETNNLSSRKKDNLDDNAGSLKKVVKKLSLKDKSNYGEEGDSKDDDHKENKDEGINKQHDDLSKKWRYAHNHPKDLLIGDPS